MRMMTSAFAYRLPLFQAPDTPAAGGGDPPAPEPAAGDPPAAPAAGEAPPAGDPPAVEDVDPPAPGGDDPPARVHGNTGRKPWYNVRISEESEARRRAERERDDYKAMIERLQGGAADPNAPPAPRNPADDDARVTQRAAEIVAQQQIQTVISKGVEKFEDWDDRVEVLGSAGAASPEFVMDVISVDPDNAHAILHQLSEDPERAARLAKMNSRARTIELVKMSMSTKQPGAKPAAAAPAAPVPPKSVSRAPAPPPPVEPGSSPAVDWRSDKVSDADFSAGWEENQRKRAARR